LLIFHYYFADVASGQIRIHSCSSSGRLSYFLHSNSSPVNLVNRDFLVFLLNLELSSGGEGRVDLVNWYHVLSAVRRRVPLHIRQIEKIKHFTHLEQGLLFSAS
jgi:hypothetical protein